jgi:hypothetical protein
MNTPDMTAQDIEHYLALLGQELEALGIARPVRLLMIGGGFMLTQIGNRKYTKDVDVVLFERDDFFDTGDYQVFRSAIHYVAQDVGLDLKWLSDNITDFVIMSGFVPKGKLWRKFGKLLYVYIPSAEFILAHKLGAGRDKDEGDIRALLKKLRVKTRDKAIQIFEKYIPDEDMRQESNIEEMLRLFFPDG